MPAIAKKNDSTHRSQALADDLAAVLRQPDTPPGEPLIVENQIGQTKSVHAVVVWDAWKNLSSSDRSAIILDAYAKAQRLRGWTFTVVMGVTGEEALRMGFLPYSIVTTRRKGDKPSQGALARAMARAGGIVVKIGSAMQLRFATMSQAEDAYRRLAQAVPGPYWAIVQEQAAPE